MSLIFIFLGSDNFVRLEVYFEDLNYIQTKEVPAYIVSVDWFMCICD